MAGGRLGGGLFPEVGQRQLPLARPIPGARGMSSGGSRGRGGGGWLLVGMGLVEETAVVGFHGCGATGA